ncbi:uncharacterized protein LOC110431592, partial [Sorghum bicolor]|uniref:uncharacterized protein LOC110431592 n=1 Tax=Sorghum bicolor TaxID=4558 RepID=UPI000B4269D0
RGYLHRICFDALQAELQNEKKQREETDAKLVATSATVEAQNAALAMQQTRLEELTKFLAAVGEKSGLSLPPELLHPLPLPVPVLPTPQQSAGSNPTPAAIAEGIPSPGVQYPPGGAPTS